MRTTRRATRERLTSRTGVALPDGVDGSVTGGPVTPIDLMMVVNRFRADSRGGAVSGAAQVAMSLPGPGIRRSPGIALSDGSRITFASIGDAGVLRDEDARLLAEV